MHLNPSRHALSIHLRLHVGLGPPAPRRGTLPVSALPTPTRPRLRHDQAPPLAPALALQCPPLPRRARLPGRRHRHRARRHELLRALADRRRLRRALDVPCPPHGLRPRRAHAGRDRVPAPRARPAAALLGVRQRRAGGPLGPGPGAAVVEHRDAARRALRHEPLGPRDGRVSVPVVQDPREFRGRRDRRHGRRLRPRRLHAPRQRAARRVQPHGRRRAAAAARRQAAALPAHARRRPGPEPRRPRGGARDAGRGARAAAAVPRRPAAARRAELRVRGAERADALRRAGGQVGLSGKGRGGWRLRVQSWARCHDAGTVWRREVLAFSVRPAYCARL